MVKFIHTADWQLGMKRHFFTSESQARYSNDSYDAIRALGTLAHEERVPFILVSGDVYESNFVERKTILRSLDAMKQVRTPFYLLPGNHDPLDSSSVFLSKIFQDNKPANVTVLNDDSVIEAAPGVQLIGIPWRSKRPFSDIICESCSTLEASSGIIRIVAGHGVVSTLSMNRDNPAIIQVPTLEKMIVDGLIQYVALGDRHSVTNVGNSGRIWYSGSPLATDFDEERSGNALLVNLDQHCSVQEKKISDWQFIRKTLQINDDADIDTIGSMLDSFDRKDKTVLKLGFKGTVSFAGKAKLDDMLNSYVDTFAAILDWESESDLTTSFDEVDLYNLKLQGFAEKTLKKLLESSRATGDTAKKAGDAIALLYRLAKG